MCSIACCSNENGEQEVIQEEVTSQGCIQAVEPPAQAPAATPSADAPGVELGKEAKQDPQPGVFLVRFDRGATEKTAVGLDITANDHIIHIVKVTGGMTQKWNETNPSLQVCAGDSIPKVNGIRGDLQLMKTLIQKAEYLEILIRKANYPVVDLATENATITSAGNARTGNDAGSLLGRLIVKVDRITSGEEKLGLNISAKDHVIDIEEVKDGMMKKWNDANPSVQVRAGDSILKVNGVQGDLPLMLAVIAKADTLEMVIRRARNS